MSLISQEEKQGELEHVEMSEGGDSDTPSYSWKSWVVVASVALGWGAMVRHSKGLSVFTDVFTLR
jgi:hypothetical protein